MVLFLRLVKNIHPGSRRPPDTNRVEECATLGRPVPTLDGRCRPTWALGKVPRALPVGLHVPCNNSRYHNIFFAIHIRPPSV